MYHAHFGLAAEPFSLTPDPAFLHLGRHHREALVAVERGIRAGRGFVTVVGEVGTGKTTVLYALLGRLDADVSTAFVSAPTRDFVELLRCGVTDFGVDLPPEVDRAGLLAALDRHLQAAADAGRPAALVIDEAQNLSDETFEHLLALSEEETPARRGLRIVLAGQPELAARLSGPSLCRLLERVCVRAVLDPLRPDEMMAYVAHRLQVAGGTIDLFAPRARALVVRRAAGIPRRANVLCHNALLLASARALPRVTAGVVREAIRDIDGRRAQAVVPLSRRWWTALVAGLGRRGRRSPWGPPATLPLPPALREPSREIRRPP